MGNSNIYGKMRSLSVAVLLGVGACTSSIDRPGPTATQTHSPAPSPQKSTPVPESASTDETGQRCRAENVDVRLSQAEGAAGSSFYQLAVLNTGLHDCTVNSLQVTAVDAQGSSVGEEFTKEGEITPLSLKAGTQYSSTLRISQLAADACEPVNATGIKVSINGNDTVVSSEKFQACSGKLKDDKTMSTFNK